MGSLEGSGTAFLGNKSLTVGGNNVSVTFAGVISDGGVDFTTGESNNEIGGSIVKTGTGMWTLSGTSTYTGSTTVQNGALNVTGVLANTNVVVGNSGTAGLVPTLSGGVSSGALTTPSNTSNQFYTPSSTSGAIASGVTINGPGSGSAGCLFGATDNVSTLQVGSLTLNTGAITNWQFSSTANSFVNVTGALSLGNSIGVNLYTAGTQAPLSKDGTYDLFQFGTLSGNASNLSVLNANGLHTYTFGTDGNYLTLTVGDSGAQATSGAYSLLAAAGSARIVTGGTTGVTVTINNTGTGTQDCIGYTGLSATGATLGGGAADGGPLDQGMSGSDANLSFSGTTVGTYTITPTVGTVTNGTASGTPLATGTTAATVNVVAQRTITNGTVVNFGTLHVGAAVSGTSTFTTSGLYAETTSVSVAARSGMADANGVTLTGSANNFDGSLATQSGSRVLGGTVNTVGNLNGSFSLGVTTLENGGTGIPGEGTYSPVTVSYAANVYSGLMIWNGATNTSWGTGSNWTDSVSGGAQAAPGLDAGFVQNDTATFGTPGVSNIIVNLDGSSPSLKGITFNGNSSCTIAKGSGGTLIVNNGTSAATITVAGTQTISAPITMASDVNVTTTGASDRLLLSGILSGTNAMAKNGLGTLTLAGNNIYTGLTTVQSGALLVNGSITGNVTVAGGSLGGSGRIGGSVVNQSQVSPGNSPGTLTIAGNYTQTSTGSLLIQLASPTVYDKLVVGGHATLDGTLQVSLLNGFTPKRGETFEFLTAADGVSGAISKIDTDTLIKLSLVEDPTGVTLVAGQGLFADVAGLTPNELAVAKGLDKVADKQRVSKLIDYLDGVSEAAIPQKLEKIVPTDLIPMFDASIASAQVQVSNLERRMEEIQNGAIGFSAAGLSLIDSHGTRSYNGNDAKQFIDKDGKDLGPTPLDDRWGCFINGSGEFVDEESTAIARGTDFTTGGITTGADYRLGEHAAVGLMAGYANTSTNGRGDGSVKIDSGKAGLYATVFDRGFFLNSIVGGGANSYDTARDTLGGLARGDANGNDFNALLGTGYTYRKGGFSAGPIASMCYSWAGIDGFTEHGSLAPLQISDQSEDSLKSTAGFQTSYVIQFGKMTVTPQVRAQWQHEYLDTTRGIGASFLPGGAFTVNGPDVGRDSLLLDAGITVQLTKTVSIFSYYTGDIGRENYTLNSINGGIQMEF